jgi:hypothetical protein
MRLPGRKVRAGLVGVALREMFNFSRKQLKSR